MSFKQLDASLQQSKALINRNIYVGLLVWLFLARFLTIMQFTIPCLENSAAHSILIITQQLT